MYYIRPCCSIGPFYAVNIICGSPTDDSSIPELGGETVTDSGETYDW